MPCAKIIGVLISLSVFTCCRQGVYVSRKTVSDKMQSQSGYHIPENKTAGRFDLPSGIDTLNGISETEAVQIALWNNASFQADLSDILLANAEVINAAIIQNPLLRYLAPAGGIASSGYVNFAIDFLWQRPNRIAAARLNADRTRDSLVQRGFTMIRDVQLGYTDLLLAEERLKITRDNAGIRTEMNRLATARLRHGDISELEAKTFQADSASAADDVFRAELTVMAARNQLNFILGFVPVDKPLQLQKELPDTLTSKILKENYLSLALSFRPDIQAAQSNIAAAGKALGWEKSKIISFTATLNYQSIKSMGDNARQWLPNAFNPGLQAEIPLFNRNQGNIEKSKAQLEKAQWQYHAVLQRVMLEVIQSYAQYEQSYQSYQVWNQNIIPPLEEAVSLVQQTYERGDISYLPVLEAIRQLQNARIRHAEARAQVRRAVSHLNFSIGQKIYM